jgi:nucleoside-diphosphate-sugar epimerase
MSTVLATGGTGFIGAHCILQLLQAGHQVRTTVRDLKRESDILAMLKVGGIEPGNRLNIFAADLERDTGWDVAATGCDYVLHVASPFPMTVPEHEDDLIIPAREGALRVLRAARDAGVKRVVLTSSFAAIGYGLKKQPPSFDETYWTDLDGPVAPYPKSKTLAERAAILAALRRCQSRVVGLQRITGHVQAKLHGRVSIEDVRRLNRAVPATSPGA